MRTSTDGFRGKEGDTVRPLTLSNSWNFLWFSVSLHQLQNKGASSRVEGVFHFSMTPDLHPRAANEACAKGREQQSHETSLVL